LKESWSYVALEMHVQLGAPFSMKLEADLHVGFVTLRFSGMLAKPGNARKNLAQLSRQSPFQGCPR
jgi:hypothetical protein